MPEQTNEANYISEEKQQTIARLKLEAIMSNLTHSLGHHFISPYAMTMTEAQWDRNDRIRKIYDEILIKMNEDQNYVPTETEFSQLNSEIEKFKKTFIQ